MGGNCEACHAGGNNSVVAEKTLKQAAIEKYLTGGYNIEAIKTQVTNGKGSMPAFGEKLGPDDIEDVATYVFGQAAKGWRVLRLLGRVSLEPSHQRRTHQVDELEGCFA